MFVIISHNVVEEFSFHIHGRTCVTQKYGCIAGRSNHFFHMVELEFSSQSQKVIIKEISETEFLPFGVNSGFDSLETATERVLVSLGSICANLQKLLSSTGKTGLSPKSATTNFPKDAWGYIAREWVRRSHEVSSYTAKSLQKTTQPELTLMSSLIEVKKQKNLHVC